MFVRLLPTSWPNPDRSGCTALVLRHEQKGNQVECIPQLLTLAVGVVNMAVAAAKLVIAWTEHRNRRSGEVDRPQDESAA